MSRETLEVLIREVIAAQAGVPVLHFAWQGGEPTLAGLAFFREVVALQQRLCPPGVAISNALQTNATLVDRDWAEFLAANRFLVGISLDGPAPLHDPLRRDRRGRATLAKSLRGLAELQQAGVQYNSLTVIHRGNYARGRSVYRFLRRIGVRHMQFIPLVERLDRAGAFAPPPPAQPSAVVSPWTAPPAGVGEFLCDVFDEWIANDVGRVYVQAIEEHVAALAGRPPGLCVFGANCSSAPLVEANGDVYSCDHYAYPAYRLGNIRESAVGALLGSERQAQFGDAKRADRDETCRACRFTAVCRGGCPKHRFVPAGGAMRNYLCDSYRRFFSHTQPILARFANAAALDARAGK